jgi:aquaporin NIP
MRKYISEFIGTFALVFCGTGAVIVNELGGGVVTHVGVSFVFGLIVTAMIYALGDVSGAHINPAVSFAFWTQKELPLLELLKYMVSQVAGAFAASLLLKTLFPESISLGATIPAGSDVQSFILEIILTFILVFVIAQVAKGSKEKGIMAGIAIGSVVLLEALFAGPISGASMNPARSLAPAMLSGNLQSLWVYLTAPFIGAYLGVTVSKIVTGSK